MNRLCVEMIDMADFAGKSVLDVGGYDGRYAARCLERGAADAVVFDSEQWRHYGWSDFQPLPGVQYVRGDLTDARVRELVPADVVLCFNVLYHVKDVWGACEALRHVTRERCLVYTQILPGVDGPVWRNWQRNDANYNDMCYWRPSERGLISLLNEVGFARVTVAGYGDDDRIGLVCKASA